MPGPRIARSLIRKVETDDLPVQALQAIRELRAYLDDREATHLPKARELGASSTGIAEALGITRPGRLTTSCARSTREARRTNRDPRFGDAAAELTVGRPERALASHGTATSTGQLRVMDRDPLLAASICF